jgi:hypothetical protein
MDRRTRSPIRILSGMAAALVSTACLLTLTAGPTATPGAALPPDAGPAPAAETEAPPPPAEPTAEPTLTLTRTPTLTFTPTWTATSTETPLTMTAGQKLSCVKGPHWVLYDWVTSIENGETVTLLARGMTDEEYYYIRKSDGKECWAFGGSSTKSGPTSGLPERESPPYPAITYTIENQFNITISGLWIRGADETAWGADRLGAATVPHGGTFSLTLTAGFYDVQIDDLDGYTLYSKMDTPIGPEQGSRYIVLNTRFSRDIRNNTGVNLCRMQIRPAGGAAWENLAVPGDGIFSAGETVSISVVGGGYSINLFRCSDDGLQLFSSLIIKPGLPVRTYP